MFGVFILKVFEIYFELVCNLKKRYDVRDFGKILNEFVVNIWIDNIY